jgi:hypothetical protein
VGRYAGPGDNERKGRERSARGPLREEWAGARPTRGKRGRRGVCWASGGFGPWKEREEEGVLAHAGERGGKRAGLGQDFELGCLLLFSFLFFFCFSNSLIQTILFEFKYNLNSNLYTQHK